MPHKIIQKDYTFEIQFTGNIFNYHSIIKKIKNNKSYNIIDIETKWRFRRPFIVKIIAIIKIVEKVDIEKMRNIQHKNLIRRDDNA